MGGRAKLVAAALGLLAAGCVSAPAQALAELKADQQKAEELSARLGQLEHRLLGTQARVRHWQELKERHEQVSALACANLSEHAEQMLVQLERQQQKQAKRRRLNPRLEGGIGGPAP